MKNLIVKLKEGRVRQTILFLAVGIALVLISLLVGKVYSTPNVLAFFIGTGVFFYGIPRYWERALFYAIMIAVFIILIIVEFKVGIGLLVKLFPGGHAAEDMAWSVGETCLAGILAGIIGIIIYRKRKK